MRSFTPNRHCRSIVALCCCVVLAGGLACDSTAPDPNDSPINRLRGTYELTVALDTYTYSGCSPSYSNPTPNCRDTTYAVSGRRLHGFVTLGDTVPASTFTTSSENVFFDVPAGTLTVINCDTCSARAVSYPTTIATVPRNNLATLSVTLEPAGFLNLDGQIANGEIKGMALSATYLGAMPHDQYTGTFIAKRQP